MEKRNEDGLTESEFLAQYNPNNYEKPSVTADIVIFRNSSIKRKTQLLLIKRKNHPFIEQWALPGGFIDINESAYNAARRELEEETGISDVELEQLCTMSEPNRDPRMRVISIAYMAIIMDKQINPIANDDAKDALWFDINYDDTLLRLINEENDIHIVYDLKNNMPKCLSKDVLAFDHINIILAGLNKY